MRDSLEGRAKAVEWRRFEGGHTMFASEPKWLADWIAAGLE